MDDYNLSLCYKNGVKCEWKKKDKQYEPYIYDGMDHHLATLERLIALPLEICNIKDGVFYKGNSDATSWKLRYFYIRGGLMTYFKDSKSSQPQGTIPLKDCVIEYPNDKRKSFIRLGRSNLDGYELKISHSSRRPFIIAFSNSKDRDDWKIYLTKYIAQTFISNEYHLAEIIESVSMGFYTFHHAGILGLDGQSDEYQEEPSPQYFYIDWYSSDPTQWCLRYSTTRLRLRPSSSDLPNEYEFDPTLISRTIPLQRLAKVFQVDSPSKAICFHIYNGSSCHPGGIGEVWTLIPPQESLVPLWIHAFQSALKLQDVNVPTQPHRRSSLSMNTLKAQLTATMEPVKYTRLSFVKEKYAIEHGNEYDLLGAGVQELGRNLLMQDLSGTANLQETEMNQKISSVELEHAEQEEDAANQQQQPQQQPNSSIDETVFQFADATLNTDQKDS